MEASLKPRGYGRDPSTKPSWTAIGGATSAEYTPVLEDAGHYLRVTVRYSDGEGPGKAANGVSEETVQGMAATPRD